MKLQFLQHSGTGMRGLSMLVRKREVVPAMREGNGFYFVQEADAPAASGLHADGDAVSPCGRAAGGPYVPGSGG